MKLFVLALLACAHLAAVVNADALAPPPIARSDDAGSVSAFPGQHAPTPSTWRFPVWPAACRGIADPTQRLACAEFNLEDWPRLSRYANANAALARPQPGETRVVFFGDSITDNWSRLSFGGFFPGTRYVNRGIGGQTTAQMLVRFRADAIVLRPVAVVILAGINDLGGNSGLTTPQAITNNLASMADLAAANHIRVLMGSILPVSPRFAPKHAHPQTWARNKNAKIVALNQGLAELCRAGGHRLVDYHAALADKDGFLKANLTYDGLHPNAAGYAVMKTVVEAALATALDK